MYSILMDENKYLKATKTQMLYQGENYVDNIYFILPQLYDGIDISSWTCALTIKYPNNLIDIEILEPDDIPYKENYTRYVYKSKSSNLTKYVGTVTLGLKLEHVDQEQLIQYSLTTSTIDLEISPISTIYNFSDDSLNKFDEIIGKLDAKANTLSQMIISNQVDDLGLDSEGTLHVSKHGVNIGTGVNVTLPSFDDINDEAQDGILDLTKIEL